MGHDDVLRAASVLDGVVHRTPVFTSRSLDEGLAGHILFKGEHLQRTGAFKFRGAYHALSRLDRDQRAAGVVTWSSGNHAAAVALAGRLLGVSVTVVMPDDAMAIKRAAVRDYGAAIEACAYSQRESVGADIARREGRVIIPPYDHDDIIAGQGTAALELLQDRGPLDLLVCPVGGAGLLAGSALAAAAAWEPYGPPRVVGVEPAVADDAARSLQAGRVVTIDVPDTLADGLRTRFIGQRNFAVLKQHVDAIVTVTESEIIDALRWLWLRMKLVVEPSGAVGLAALLAGRLDARGARVGVLLSGGNVDPAAVGPLLS